MPLVSPSPVGSNARTQEGSVYVDPHSHHDHRLRLVLLLVKISIVHVIGAMVFGAVFGFLIGLFITPPLTLNTLQWSLLICVCFLLSLLTIGLYIMYMLYMYRKRLRRHLDENLHEDLVENPDGEQGNPEEEELAADFMEKYNEMLEMMQYDKTYDVPLTQDEENWVRLSFLLVEEGTRWVAKILTDYLREQRMTFQQLLDANRRTLGRVTGTGRPGTSAKPGQKAVLSPDHLNLLFPEANLAELDLTLLVLLIGVLRILDEPPCKWSAKQDPPDTDTDKASDLVRLRLMRKHLYEHIVECAISTEDFEVYFEKLLAILERLGAVPTELDKLKDRERVREERRAMSKRITILFSGDMRDAEEIAMERMKELAENHKMRLQLEENSDERPPGLFV